MKAFKQYVKGTNRDKLDARPRSVNITAEQDAFLKTHDINLSALVRDVLSDIIKKRGVK